MPGPPDGCVDDEQCIALTRDFRLLQKRRGHRYSVDDMLVAHLACTRGGSPRRVLDLGCGLGSVLLITAWAFRDAHLVGLEVLAEHVAFARRNILLDGCEARARVVHGDLRDRALVESLGPFDLVTGSPPYFGPGSGTLCADRARAAAHFEINGGIEDYAAAADRSLTPGGLFVTCAGAEPPRRAQEAFGKAGLSVLYRQAVVPRTGRKPFLILLVGVKGPGYAASTLVEAPPLILRDEEGRLTPQHDAIRQWTGITQMSLPRIDPSS